MDVFGKKGSRLFLRLPDLEYSPSLGRHARAVSNETLRLLEQRREGTHGSVVALLRLARDERSNEDSHVSASLPSATTLAARSLGASPASQSSTQERCHQGRGRMPSTIRGPGVSR